ncbi:MAG: response regulator transcription factor [Candidatus Rokubacteria bacterium]|nr:response regulator transcription factor [Candidatus Rokubacteria bacterium]
MSRGGFFAVDSLSSVHVLVVDDDASFREVLVSLLRYCRSLVTAFATPEEALAAMDQVKPDVLVITVGPGSPAAGLPRRERGRKPEDGGNAPIVVVLREGAGDVVLEGVNLHLREPLNPWELCGEISALLASG